MDGQPSRPAVTRMRHSGPPDGDLYTKATATVHFGSGDGDA
jgi:hypothetical protein